MIDFFWHGLAQFIRDALKAGNAAIDGRERVTHRDGLPPIAEYG
jgi:hypothetical protein